MKKFSMAILLRQLENIRQELGLNQFDFDARLRTKNLLTRWKMGRTKILKLETLIAISQEFNKSLDWLIFGDRPDVSYVKPEADLYYPDAQAPAPADLDLIADCGEAVAAHLQQYRLKISPRRIGLTISILYEHCLTKGERPDPELVKAYLLLTRTS